MDVFLVIKCRLEKVVQSVSDLSKVMLPHFQFSFKSECILSKCAPMLHDDAFQTVVLFSQNNAVIPGFSSCIIPSLKMDSICDST